MQLVALQDLKRVLKSQKQDVHDLLILRTHTVTVL